MTDKTSIIFITTVAILASVTLGNWQTKRQIAELKGTFEQTTIPSASNAERIDSYNAGYRAGRLEAVAELVECHDVDDKAVLTMYDEMSDVLARLGELDTEPYPCTE